MMATSRPRDCAALAHELRALLVVGGGAVREVEAHDVNARREHAGQHVRRAASGSDGGDDLGGAMHGLS